MEAYERLIRYIGIDTVSDEESETTPSTPCQFDLSRALEREMREMGLQDVYLDDHAYVYGKIPATAGLENAAKIGFIAHLDTVTTGKNGIIKVTSISEPENGRIAELTFDIIWSK